MNLVNFITEYLMIGVSIGWGIVIGIFLILGLIALIYNMYECFSQ